MNDELLVHTESTFKASQGVELYQQWWAPPGEKCGVVVICHGIAEHSGRYDHIARYLVSRGYQVGSFDLRNHGHSGDHSIYVHSFDDYLNDMDIFLSQAVKLSAGKPVFLLGHSMGGTITTLYTITRQPNFLNGIVLSAPAVKFGSDISPSLIKLAGILSILTPHLKTVKLDNASISHDPDVKSRYDSDPLNYRQGVPARTGAELNRAILAIQAGMATITLPVLILHGSADQLADINGSRMLYEAITSSDKTLKIYEGFYHEIMNEVEKERVLNDIGNWLDAHRP